MLVLESYILDPQTLLFSAVNSNSSLNYIFIYNIPNASFTQYKFSDAKIDIFGISHSFTSNRLVLYGDYDNEYAYAVHSLIDSLQDVNEISEELSQIFNTLNISDYQLLDAQISNPSYTYLAVDAYTTLSYATRTVDINIDVNSDLVYFLDTPTNNTLFSLVEGWEKNVSINLTCSMSGTTEISHTIEGYGGYAVPSWVQLDEDNFQLLVFAPSVKSDSDYHFQIRTDVNDSSTSYHMLVNLTILN